MKNLLISCLAISAFIYSCTSTPEVQDCIDCPVDTTAVDSTSAIDSVKVDSTK
jgi:hypothetical protein